MTGNHRTTTATARATVTPRTVPGRTGRPNLTVPRPDVFPAPPRTRPVCGVGGTGIGTGTGTVAGDATRDPAGGGHRPRWVFMAAHGGAGATTLAGLSRAAHDQAVDDLARGADPGAGPFWFATETGTGWPDPARTGTGLVVVVARTTAPGLGWARDVARQHLAGGTPRGVVLLGVVTIADQPGRLPAPLTRSLRLLGGVYQHHWQLPYLPEYRLTDHHHHGSPPDPGGGPGGGVRPPRIHPAVVDTLTAIRTVILEGTP